jgi:hypothetical protein
MKLSYRRIKILRLVKQYHLYYFLIEDNSDEYNEYNISDEYIISILI